MEAEAEAEAAQQAEARGADAGARGGGEPEVSPAEPPATATLASALQQTEDAKTAGLVSAEEYSQARQRALEVSWR